MNISRHLLIIFIVLLGVSAEAQQRPEPILVDEFGTMVRGSSKRARVVTTKTSTRVMTALSVEQTTFDLMNRERASKGLSRLVWNESIAEVARLHSINMAENNFFSHRGLDGKMVDDRADLLGINNWKAIGENIAFMRGYDKPDKVAVEKWLDSTSHRRNMLSPTWNESAIGVAYTKDGTYYFTQVFMVKK